MADSPANYELLLEISCDEKIGHLPAATACLEEEDAEAVWSGLRDTTSAKELTTNLPHYSLFQRFFLHEHRKDKS